VDFPIKNGGSFHCKGFLVGGLEHEFYDFPYIGNNHPNWLSYFSEGLKPPTSFYQWIGFLGKIETGNHRFSHEDHGAFLKKKSLKSIHCF